jgi:pSer/pThr/pTyr-binding forkhead associated (FHA) protein
MGLTKVFRVMLKIVFADQRFEAYWLTDKQVAIGSGDDNQLTLNDPSVSPRHARIVATSDGFVIKDNGSHLGTFVNGEPVAQAKVAAGDVVRLGEIKFTLEDPMAGLDGMKSGMRSWSLVACSNFLSGQEFALPGSNDGSTRLTLGRGKDCDLVFPGTHLSRQHLAITLHDDHLVLEDLNSANGSFINETRIQVGKALPGDKIRLDVYTFKVLGPNLSEPRVLIQSPARRGDLKPTSPGNRTEAEEVLPQSPWPSIVSLVFLALFIALAVYLFI